MILPLLLMLFATGCLGSGDGGVLNRGPEASLDAAQVKVAVAQEYLAGGEVGKAVRALEDAKADLGQALTVLNTSLTQIPAELLTVQEDLDLALDLLRDNNNGEAKDLLDRVQEGLLEAAIALRGREEVIAPVRFEVIGKEIPLTYYGTVDGVYLGYQVAPHNVAAKAREAFYRYHETGSSEDLERGLFLTEFLISTASDRDGFVVWENPFPWPAYDLPRGWIGALSQAGCLKALMLAYQATGDERYRDYSERALSAFAVDLRDGGLRTDRTDGSGIYTWFPEYAKTEPPYVLNGFITAVVWIGEYSSTMESPEAAELYDEGIRSIKHYLPTYVAENNWSLYDAIGHRSSEHYHRLHLSQMKMLYDLTGDELFREYAAIWAG